jgi:hypothetical protein
MGTFDGLPVGIIRSNLTDANVTAEKWCGTFGHKIVTGMNDERYCKNCWKSEKEINGESETRQTEEQSKSIS